MTILAISLDISFNTDGFIEIVIDVLVIRSEIVWILSLGNDWHIFSN